jgi:1-phosphatidylinositol-4-phosphate 5-kinase
MKHDQAFMLRHKLLDYSLLLGVHFVGQHVRTPGENLPVPKLSPFDKLTGIPTRRVVGGKVLLDTQKEDVRNAVARLPHSQNVFTNGVEAQLVTDYEKQDVLVFFGIIDILCPWRAYKAGEVAWKKTVLQRKAITAANPKEYADRFLAFAEQAVFREGN